MGSEDDCRRRISTVGDGVMLSTFARSAIILKSFDGAVESERKLIDGVDVADLKDR